MKNDDDREFQIRLARIHLREARARRKTQPCFSVTLMEWSARARRRAMEAKPVQGCLF